MHQQTTSKQHDAICRTTSQDTSVSTPTIENHGNVASPNDGGVGGDREGLTTSKDDGVEGNADGGNAEEEEEGEGCVIS